MLACDFLLLITSLLFFVVETQPYRNESAIPAIKKFISLILTFELNNRTRFPCADEMSRDKRFQPAHLVSLIKRCDFAAEMTSRSTNVVPQNAA